MNLSILTGRLTKDPEARQTANGSMARFTLAVDRIGKDKNADFIPCVAFGKTADSAATHLHKGTKIALDGRIQTGSYTNKEGVKVYTTDVIVNHWEFCESKQREAEKKPDGPDGFMNVPDGIDEELPFN